MKTYKAIRIPWSLCQTLSDFLIQPGRVKYTPTHIRDRNGHWFKKLKRIGLICEHQSYFHWCKKVIMKLIRKKHL